MQIVIPLLSPGGRLSRDKMGWENVKWGRSQECAETDSVVRSRQYWKSREKENLLSTDDKLKAQEIRVGYMRDGN